MGFGPGAYHTSNLERLAYALGVDVRDLLRPVE
jgi:hypothetical protein